MNMASGYNALQLNISGNGNVAGGPGALAANLTGSYNTATGDQALYNNTNGNWNAAFGPEHTSKQYERQFEYGHRNSALYSKPPDEQTALEYNAGYSVTTGSQNIEIGNSAAPPINNTSKSARRGADQHLHSRHRRGNDFASGSSVYVNQNGNWAR